MSIEAMNAQEVKDGTPRTILLPYGGGQINFQCGPIKEVGNNGCQIEDVLEALIARLGAFQRGTFPCRENALALTKMEEALMWMEKRKADREKRNVEGKNEK